MEEGNTIYCEFCRSNTHLSHYCESETANNIVLFLHHKSLLISSIETKEVFISCFENAIHINAIRLLAHRMNVSISNEKRTIINDIYDIFILVTYHNIYRRQNGLPVLTVYILNSQLGRRQLSEIDTAFNELIDCMARIIRNRTSQLQTYSTNYFQRLQDLQDFQEYIYEYSNNEEPITRQPDQIEEPDTKIYTKKPRVTIWNINEENNETIECPICYVEIIPKENVRTNCQHSFCTDCVNTIYKVANRNHCEYIHCPICRTNVTYVEIHPENTRIIR